MKKLPFLTLATILGTLALPAHAATILCSDYTKTIILDNSETLAQGTACQKPDGSWQTISKENLVILENFNNIEYVRADNIYIDKPVFILPQKRRILVKPMPQNEPWKKSPTHH